MINKLAGILLLVLISQSVIVFADEFYTVSIICPNKPGYGTDSVSIHAKSDLDAMNEANKILLDNSKYKGKGCLVKEVRNG